MDKAVSALYRTMIRLWGLGMCAIMNIVKDRVTSGVDSASISFYGSKLKISSYVELSTFH